METNTNQLDQLVQTHGGLALYVHIHTAYYGLAVFDKDQHQFHQISTTINHTSDSEVDQNTNAAIDNGSLNDWIELHKDVFTTPFAEIRICVSTTMFHLINDDRLATVGNFALMNKFDKGQVEILSDRIHEDLHVQFGLEKNLYSLLNSHFETSNIHFGERGLLQLLSVESDLIADAVYCQLLGQDATVAIISSSKLIFFNKYSVKNREDLLYYILLCYQSHGLEAENVTLFLSGLIEADSPLYELIYDYIRHVEWMSLPGQIDIPQDENGSDQFSLHSFINLLSIR